MINRQENRFRRFRHRVSPEAKAAYERKIEEENPGYLWESKKHETIVWILTGVRALYAVFYLIMTLLMGFDSMGQIFILLQLVLFYIWATLMIRFGGLVAVFLLAVRGLDIIRSGPALLALSPYTSLIWIFVLVLALVIEFVEAVFCIYLLFNHQAVHTIRLKRIMDRELPGLEDSVSRETVETMAGYQNPLVDSADETEGLKREVEVPEKEAKVSEREVEASERDVEAPEAGTPEERASDGFSNDKNDEDHA